MIRIRFSGSVLFLFALILGLLVGRACAHAQVVSEERPHLVTLLGGYGPDGVQAVGDQHHAYVDVFVAPLWGINWTEWMRDRWSASAMFLTGVTPHSKTITGAMGVGYNW